MPYDYSHQFLLKHREWVKLLQEVATSRTVRKFPFSSWEELRTKQNLINNLLASMSRNVAGAEQLRKVVGCWTEWGEGGTYNLWVGTKDNKPPAGVKRSELYVPFDQAQAMATGKSVYPDPIRSKDDLHRFVYKLAGMESLVTSVELRIQDPGFSTADGQQFRAVIGGLGWMVTSADDMDHVTLGRVGAPVEQPVMGWDTSEELDIPTIYGNPAISPQWQSFCKYLETQTGEIRVAVNVDAESEETQGHLNMYLFLNVGWQIVGGKDNVLTIRRIKNA